jgi:hypothetical protein
LVKVMVWAALVVPVAWLGNVRVVGEKLTVLVTVPEPVPVSGMICGLPKAPSATVRAPVITPLTLGVNVTLMVQVLLTAMVPVQVLAEMPKSPLAVTVPMVRATVEFVKVTVCAALVLPMAVLAKVSVAGARVRGAIPFPVKSTTCVPGVALSVRVTAPSIVPSVVGDDVTLIVQEAPAASVPVQVVVSAKSPLGTMLLIVRLVVVLVFFRVTVLAALVVPAGWPLKLSATGVRVTVCARAVGIAKSKHNRHKDRQGPAQKESTRFTRASGDCSIAPGQEGKATETECGEYPSIKADASRCRILHTQEVAT